MPINGYFDVPFAADGDTTVVPDPVQGSGAVSYTQGFSIAYSTPVADGGFNFPRYQHNQILFDITSAIQNWQQNTIAPFITTAMNGGIDPYSYSMYNMVLYSGVGYISLQNANTDTPPSAKWATIPLSATGRLLNVQFITSSGTYTPTAGTNSIVVYGKAGGGGGGGTGSGSPTGGGTGGTTALGSFLSAAGGVGGPAVSSTASPSIGGVGGVATVGGYQLTGAPGQQGSYYNGGAAGFGGNGGGEGAGIGGNYQTAGSAAATNSGSGGGGAGANAGVTQAAGGGGEGGYAMAHATGITGTYTATIGGAGTAGSAGTSGYAGGAGGAGYLIIEEYS